MLVYVKYFVTWLFFMGLIAVITLVVPKLSKRIDAWRAERKNQTKIGTNTFLKPITPEEMEQPPEQPDQAEAADK